MISFFGGTLFGLVIAAAANWLFETVRSLGWETTTTRILMELFLPSCCIWARRNSMCPAFCRWWPLACSSDSTAPAWGQMVQYEYRFHFSMGCAEFLAQRCGVHSSGMQLPRA